MATVPTEVIRKHKSLLIKLCDMMDPNDQTYKLFMVYLESYIPKEMLCKALQNPTDVFALMEEKRVLKVGKYQVLKKALEVSGYVNILELLKKEEEYITRQMRKRSYSDGPMAGGSSHIDAATMPSIKPEGKEQAVMNTTKAENIETVGYSIRNVDLDALTTNMESLNARFHTVERTVEPIDRVSSIEDDIKNIKDWVTRTETRNKNQTVNRRKLNQRIGLMKGRIERHKSDTKDLHVDTRAFDHARDILFQYKHLVLQGKPGEGKTYLALSLAADLIEKNNEIQPVQIHNVNEWEEIIDTKLPLVVFLDDVLGKYGLSETDLDSWKKISELIHPNLNSSSIFLIICIRTQIVLSIKPSLLRNEAFSLIFNSHVVDICDDKHCLTMDERMQMLVKYAPTCIDTHDTFAIHDILEMKNIIGFPQNCKIFRSRQHLTVDLKNVFSNNMFLVEEVEELSKTSPEVYAFLVLLMLSGGHLSLENRLDELNNKMKIISDYCGLKKKLNIGQIKNVGQTLCGTLVEYKKETNKFSFQHDCIETAVLISFVKSYQNVTLQLCSLKQLSKMCIVVTESERLDREDFLNFKIMINDTHFGVVHERFREGLESREIESFKNIAEALVWKNIRFVTYFLKTITTEDDVISFLSKRDSNGKSLLVHLIYAKSTKVVERIIKIIFQCCIGDHDIVKRQLSLATSNACLAEEKDILENLIKFQGKVDDVVMFAAASTGNVSIMEMLILEKGNINASVRINNRKGLVNAIQMCMPNHFSCHHEVNLFHTACTFGRTDMVKYLTTRYPELVHKTSNLGWTAIHFATVSENIELVKSLSVEVDPEGRTREDESLFHTAAANSDIRMVNYLIKTIPRLIQTTDKNGCTAAHSAAKGGSVLVMRALSEAGLDITAGNNDGIHVLHIAVINDNIQMAKYLIETNPGLIQQSDNNGLTALHFAAGGSSVAMMEKLIKAGLDITARTIYGAHVLHIAAISDNLSIAKYLIDTNPISLPHTDNEGRTALHYAAASSGVPMMDILTAVGLDTTSRTNNGGHVLHIAASYDNLEVVKYLTETNPGLLQQADKYGRTAGHSAAATGNVSVMETLIQAGLDIATLTKNGSNVLHAAAITDNVEVVKYLIRNNTFLSQQTDKNGWTALHFASVRSSVLMIETLIEAGLDITARTNDGAHVLHIAAVNNNLTIVKYLIQTIPSLLQQSDSNGRTALHYAALGISVSMMKTIRAARLDIRTLSDNGSHGLHIEACNDNLEVVTYLIETNPVLLQQIDKNGLTAAHYAAARGSVPVMEILIKDGLDITARSNNGAHVLHIAASNNNLEVVKYLIKTNPLILQQSDNNGWTALHFAAAASSVAMMETLIEAGLDITSRSNTGSHVLHIAASNDNLIIVKYLIETNTGLLQLTDKSGSTALHYAAARGSVNVIDILIESGLDVTARNNNGGNVLHIAATNYDLAVVKYLIQTNPDLLHQRDINGRTALHFAAAECGVPMLETLIEAGLDITTITIEGDTLLHIAANNDNLTVVRYLIDINPGLLQQTNNNGWTALHCAAAGGSVPMMNLLKENGLDITARTNNGDHVLHIAANNENVAVVRYLTESNPGFLQQTDKNGLTAAHYAAVSDSVQLIQILIEAGVDIASRDNNGSQVIHIAAASNNLSVVKYLIQINPQLFRETDNNGWTTLHCAAIRSSVSMVEILIEAGIDVTARTSEGAHALHIAAGNDNLPVVIYLIQINPELLQETNNNGLTALHYGAVMGSVPMMETLIAAGLDIVARIYNGTHILHIAAGNNNLTVAKYLIETNPGLSQLTNNNGLTALHFAAAGSCVPMMETLIEAGMDITARANDGANVLHIAAKKDNLEVVKYLIETNPRLLQQTDINGRTALHFAARESSAPMMKILIQAGLDTRARTNDGSHVLHIAAGNDNRAVVKYLIQSNPELLQQTNDNGWTPLHYAAGRGSIPLMETLIEAGLDITTKTNNGGNILHIAASNDNLTVVKHLIENNPRLLLQLDVNRRTALHYAAASSGVLMMETLVEAGLDITAMANDGARAVHMAAKNDNLTVVTYLIQTYPGLLQQTTNNGWTALHCAAERSNVPMIKALIEAGLDITARAKDGVSVLHIAAKNDNLTVVKYLIENNSGLLKLINKDGWTALHYAAERSSALMMETLTEAGSDSTSRTNDGAHVLYIAAGNDNLPVVQYLIQTKPGLLKQTNKTGWTALHCAAGKSSVLMMKTLIEAGLDIQSRTNDGNNVLHIAAYNDILPIVQYLIQTNPELLQQTNNNGYTALHCAAGNSSVPVMETLIAAGLDIMARAIDGANVLYVALKNNNLAIVKYLIETNPKLLQQTDINGRTALHCAAAECNVPIMVFLIEAGLDIRSRTNDGSHVLHIAAKNDNLKIVRYLIHTNPELLQQTNNNGWTALHCAAGRSSVPMMQTLIKAGLDITARAHDGAHALHISAGNDNRPVVQYLIATNPRLLQQVADDGWTALHHAAARSSVSMMETLIEAGLDITARDSDGAHVLHIAAKKDNLEVAKYLIESNPSLLQLLDNNGWTAMHCAAAGSNVPMMETLIAAGLDITARDNDGAHVLHIAASNDNLKMVKYLTQTYPGLLQQTNNNGWTALHCAAEGDSVRIIETLIEAGLDISAKDSDGHNVLHIAAINDNLTVVKYWIETYPELLQQPDNIGWTTLHFAAAGGCIPMMEVLIQSGLDITARTNEGDHVLHIAAGNDNLAVVKYLIHSNPELLQQTNNNGWTPLHFAAEEGSVLMITTLIEGGSDVITRTNDGAHALHIAAGKDNLPIVEYLIQSYPGLVQQVNKNGWTALHCAGERSNVPMMETLAAAGLDITARDSDGAHVLHIAAKKDNLEVAKYLIKSNPSLLHLLDNNGWTAMHCAAAGSNVPMMEALLAAGLDITARTNDGAHVLHIAACNDNLKVVKYLIENNPRLLQQPDNNGWTVLHCASRSGSVPLMETLIEAGLDIASRTNDGADVLHIAARHANLPVVKYVTETLGLKQS